MQSILILGTLEKTGEEAQKICLENKISKFDIETIQPEKAIGIEEIRKLQEKLFLKPIHSETKTVILEAFTGMTIESQNAFLKVLEEPPANTIIIILVSSLDFILPTVLSRCNLVSLEKTEKITSQEIVDHLNIILELKGSGIGKALKIAQDNGKDRQTALQFLEKLILSVNNTVEKGNAKLNSNELLKISKNLQKTYTIIKSTNVNPRFALENLFLNL